MKKLLAIMTTLAIATAVCAPALAIEGATNAALNKPASQSTTDWGGSADKAVDGNTDGEYGNDSITHTEIDQSDPWWEVDLGAAQHIHQIRVWNRTDCCEDRLSQFYVFVSEAPFTSTDPALTAAQPHVTALFYSEVVYGSADFAINAPGQYVRIQIPGDNKTLSIAEVEVFVLGSQVPPSGTVAYSTGAWTNQSVVASLSTTKSVTITNNNGSPTYTFDDNGSFTFTYVDGMGNEGSTEAIVANIDRTAPVTVDDAPELTPGGAVVSLDAADSQSGVQMTLYQLNNGETYSGTSVYIAGAGTHTLKYWSVDYAGNAELPREITVHIAPEASLTGLSLGEAALHFHEEVPLYTTLVSNSLASLTVTPVASSNQALIKINGQPAESGSAHGVPLNPGGNKITVELWDGDSGQRIQAYTIIALRPSGERWNIVDAVRAADAQVDMNDDGVFDRNDMIELIRMI